MDVEILARLQFALTIMFHYIYPPLSIGLGLILVLIEATYLKTGELFYKDAAKFWTNIFALTFAIGVATGIVMEFEFGTNWATYSRYVGDVFGSALAAEGVFAFFLESGFLAVLLFGWNRVGPKLHFFATTMVCLGAHFSAIWILVANSWMQTPAGFHIVGEGMAARAEITDFWQMVFNPSSMDRLAHTVIGAWLAGAFLVISVSAYYLLRERYLRFATYSLKVGLGVACVSLLLQGVSGDSTARGVAVNQPMKLAAFEGLFETQRGAPLTLFGVVDSQNRRVSGIGIPKMLSLLAFHDPDAVVQGLNEFPQADWPNTYVLFHTYRAMIGSWAIMVLLVLLSLYFWRKGSLSHKRWLLWLLVFSVLLPQVANQMGWVSAEMGRYPWIVYGLLRISEGLSASVTASQVLGSIIMFTIVYAFLFLMFLYLLNEKIQKGPHVKEEDDTIPYHQLQEFVKGEAIL